MKALHWKRLILDPKKSNDSKTIWAKMGNAAFAFDATEFEALFGQNAKQKSAARRLSNATLKPKNKKIRILTDKRSNAVAIMLSQLPPLQKIKSAVLGMDLKVLRRDHVEAMFGQLPTKEELEQIKSCSDPAQLEKPETYFLIISGIPSLAPRLKCWLFSLTMLESIQGVSRTMSTLEAAFQVCQVQLL